MPRPRTTLLLAAVAFFASGAAALIYQVAWQRILALHTGVGIYSVALIVAAFMAGLGVGSHLGGVLSARLQPRHALVAFGGAECGSFRAILPGTTAENSRSAPDWSDQDRVRARRGSFRLPGRRGDREGGAPNGCGLVF